MSDIFSNIVPVTQYILLATAILVAAGGVVGFLKASSMPSLIAGVASGALTLGAFGLTFIDMKLGMVVAFVIMALLQAIFAIRLSKTKKFMPAGLMIIIVGATETLLILSLVSLFGLI